MPYTELVSTMTEHRRPATAEMAAEFRLLFVNRLAYTLQSTKPHPETGRHYYYRPKARDGGPAPALTLETVRRHLAGDITLGMYSINPKTQRSKWVAIDADYRNAIEDLLKLQYELTQDGVEPALEKSNRGGHLWIFFEAPALARDCRVYIYHTALRLGLPIKGAGLPEGIEIFPRQDEIGAHEFGNAIRAPLGVHRGAKESRGWRFWFYNADYTLPRSIGVLGAHQKVNRDGIAAIHRGENDPSRIRAERQAARDGNAVFHVGSDGVPHSRLRRG